MQTTGHTFIACRLHEITAGCREISSQVSHLLETDYFLTRRLRGRRVSRQPEIRLRSQAKLESPFPMPCLGRKGGPYSTKTRIGKQTSEPRLPVAVIAIDNDTYK